MMASLKTLEEKDDENAEGVGEQQPCMGETSTEPICRQMSVGERARQRWRQLIRSLVIDTYHETYVYVTYLIWSHSLLYWVVLI